MCKTGQSWVSNGQGLANSNYRNNLAANNPKQPEPTMVERGYLDNLPPPVDPAEALARLITSHAVDNTFTKYLAGFATAEGVRHLIRNHWSKVSALAHQIHEEGK